MRIEERQHVALSLLGAHQTGTDEAHTRLGTQNLDGHRQMGNRVVQLRAEESRNKIELKLKFSFSTLTLIPSLPKEKRGFLI